MPLLAVAGMLMVIVSPDFQCRCHERHRIRVQWQRFAAGDGRCSVAFFCLDTDQFGLQVAIPELIVDDNPYEFRYVEMRSNVVDPK
jgi:hypothetical protein